MTAPFEELQETDSVVSGGASLMTSSRASELPSDTLFDSVNSPFTKSWMYMPLTGTIVGVLVGSADGRELGTCVGITDGVRVGAGVGICVKQSLASS